MTLPICPHCGQQFLLANPKKKEREYFHLTRRELTVWQLIAGGESNQEIANSLSIEMGTVKNHVHSLLRKLNVPNRKDAAARYGQPLPPLQVCAPKGE